MDNRSRNENDPNPNHQAADPPQGHVPQLDTNQLLAQLLHQMQVMSQLIINQNQAQNQTQNQGQAGGPPSIHEQGPIEPEQRIPNEEINLPRNEVPRNEVLKGTPPINVWLNQQNPVGNNLSEVPFIPQNYPEPQNQASIHEDQKHDDMRERIEKLEQNLPKGKGIDLQNLSLYPEARLPPGFKMPELDRFNGRGSPTLHLTSYVRAMQMFGCRDPELAQMFHMSLIGPAQKWFLKLKKHQVATWTNIMDEFVSQYEANEDLEVTKQQLQMTRQGDKESFSDFVARWRELASQMTERVKEEELISIIRHNFTPTIQALIGVSYIPHFKALLSTVAEIEQMLAKKAETESSKSSSHYTSKKANTSAVHQINFSPQNPAPYSQYQYVPPPYSASPSTVEMNWASTTPHPTGNQGYRPKAPKPPRVFSTLPDSLSRTFEKLRGMGLIKPRNPTPVPNPVPGHWNMNEQCIYHQGPGHHTDNCITLQHAIQDLIDNQIIADPGGPNIA